MLTLSLFPGIGLLDMAFELEGFTVVRGPDVLWGGDIRRFHPPADTFDGIIGGPPCQSFSSLVHLVRANGHEPRFGNLIPEFERCVREAGPEWFLMENVPAAPVPTVEGYGVHSFILDNSLLANGDDGFGHEQRRVRRFSFGLRGRDAPNLMRWIDLAVFHLPDVQQALTQWPVDNSAEAKRRHEPLTGGHDRPPSVRDKGTRKRTVTALGPDHLDGLRASTNEQRKTRKNAVIAATNQNEGCLGATAAAKVRRLKAVSSSSGGRAADGTLNNSRRYRLADACRLQGLPEDFLADAPFTAYGKLKAVANGVPIPMGRAIARAVKDALSA